MSCTREAHKGHAHCVCAGNRGQLDAFADQACDRKSDRTGTGGVAVDDVAVPARSLASDLDGRFPAAVAEWISREFDRCQRDVVNDRGREPGGPVPRRPLLGPAGRARVPYSPLAHLRNIFRKLGITSRGQLVGLPLGEPGESPA